MLDWIDWYTKKYMSDRWVLTSSHNCRTKFMQVTLSIIVTSNAHKNDTTNKSKNDKIVLQPSGKKGRSLHRAFVVTWCLSLRSRIQAVSQQPEHFIMHCLARPLSQGPDQWLCFLLAGFRDDAATMCGVRASNVRSERKKYDCRRLPMIIILKHQNGTRLVYSKGLLVRRWFVRRWQQALPTSTANRYCQQVLVRRWQSKTLICKTLTTGTANMYCQQVLPTGIIKTLT